MEPRRENFSATLHDLVRWSGEIRRSDSRAFVAQGARFKCQFHGSGHWNEGILH